MATLYAAQAQNQTTSDLYTLNPVTGVPTSVGPIGYAVTGMAWDPIGGIMYGATSNNSAASPRSIITINLTTGAGTLVGALGLGGSLAASDLAFTSDGRLWGIGSTGGKLLSINKSTGAGTQIGAFSIVGQTLAALADDTFIVVAQSGGTWRLRQLTQDGGPGSQFADVGTPSDNETVNAASIGPDGLVYVSNTFHTNASLNAVDGNSSSIVVDVASLNYMDALAWDGFFTNVFSDLPVLSALSTTGITDTTANTNFHILSNTWNFDRQVEYGTTTAYGTNIGFQSFSAPYDADFTIGLSGLTSSTTYHWRVHIFLPGGSSRPDVYGPDQTFVTFGPANPPDCAIDDPPDFSGFPTVIFTGTINDNGADTTYSLFLDPVWPSSSLIEVGPFTLPAGSGPTPVSFSINLDTNTRYDADIFAQNFAGSCDTTPPFMCLITPMPFTFSACIDVVDDFTGADCTTDATDWTFSSGYRLHDGQLAAYEWQTANSAVRDNVDAVIGPNIGMELSGDQSITIVESAGIQRVGWEALSSTTSGTNPGYYAESDPVAGKIRLIKRIADIETILGEVNITAIDGDILGIRYDRFDQSLSVWFNTGSGFTQLISVIDTTYSPRDAIWNTCGATLTTDEFFYPFISQTAPAGPPDIDTSILFDASTYGQVTVDIFPPFSCPVGHDKYGWDFDVGNDQHKWDGPYFGGSTPHDYPNPAVACPNWFANLRFHAYGRIDCSLSSGTNVGNDGEFDTYMNVTQGITAARIPFYMTTSEYDTELDGFESTEGAGFFTWDTDFAHKGMDAIQASLDNIVAAFAADGAFKITNIGDGGRLSYGAFMPVKVASGRIDDFVFSSGRCVQFGVVSFSHIKTGRRPKLQIR